MVINLTAEDYDNILLDIEKLYDTVYDTEQNNKDCELQFGFNIMYLLIDDIKKIMVI